MAVTLQAGVREYVVIKLKLGSEKTVPRKVSAMATPYQVVSLLALCQILTIFGALINMAGKWWIYATVLAIIILMQRNQDSVNERLPLQSSHNIISRWWITWNSTTNAVSKITSTLNASVANIFADDNLCIVNGAAQEVFESCTKLINCLFSAVLDMNTRPYNAQLKSPLLVLPSEIRMIIYRELLIPKEPRAHFRYPNALVNARRVGLFLPIIHYQLAALQAHKLGTSTNFLGTCRRIYEEALPILYGENRFAFRDCNEIRTFQTAGLATSCVGNRSRVAVPIFNLQPNPQGRCAMIRHLELYLEADQVISRADCLEYYQSEEAEQQSWSAFIHQSTYTHDPKEVCFTALETLKLQFSSRFFPDSYLAYPGAPIARVLWVRPFVDRFRTPKGLSKLVIAGVEDYETLSAFRRGLLREGGCFEALM